MSVCLSACISADRTERIFPKFDIGEFHENLSKISEIGSSRTKPSGTLHEDINTFHCCRAILYRHKSALFDRSGVRIGLPRGTNVILTRHTVVLHAPCLSCSKLVSNGTILV